jgi:hypothetical protein
MDNIMKLDKSSTSKNIRMIVTDGPYLRNAAGFGGKVNICAIHEPNVCTKEYLARDIKGVDNQATSDLALLKVAELANLIFNKEQLPFNIDVNYGMIASPILIGDFLLSSVHRPTAIKLSSIVGFCPDVMSGRVIAILKPHEYQFAHFVPVFDSYNLDNAFEVYQRLKVICNV